MNPNSLQNLVPGARKGMKRQATQKIVEGITRFLDSKFADMIESFDNLDDKEKVAAWIKLADRFMPKPEAPEKKEEVGSKVVTLVTQLVGHESPQPLLDIVQLQKDGFLSTLAGAQPQEPSTITPKNEENEDRVIDI